jgi:flagellar hook-associated protein 2
MGTRAEFTVDGRPVVSDGNHVSTAIEGVSIDLLALGSSTVTVSPDRSATKDAVKTLVTAYNALADQLDSLTENRTDMPRGALAGESGVRGLALGLRQLLTGAASAMAGTIRSLSDIGVSTGAVGAAKGTTSRLQFDEAAFDRALDANPSRVAELLDGESGVLRPVLDRLDGWLKSTGKIKAAQDSIASILKDLAAREDTLNDRLAEKQARYEAKFATLEARLAQLQSVSGSLSAQVTANNKSSG